MIFYKNKGFFVTPKDFNLGDIEFNIYDINGDFIGTNFMGIEKCTYFSEKEKFELEELIQEYTLNLEVEIRFIKEFNVQIRDWKSLSTPRDLLLNYFTKKLELPSSVLMRNLL